MSESSTVPRYDHYIDGATHRPAEGRYLPSINPADASVTYEVARGTAADVDAAVASARRAFKDPTWRRMTPARRSCLMRELATRLRDRGPELARLETTDNGKLIREMRVQHGLIPDFWDYFAGWTDKVHGHTVPTDSFTTINLTMREPVGVVAAIVPWNSPLLLATYKLAPALAMGNTVVLKPSEHTSASAIELAKLMTEVGFPAGVVNVVTGYGHEVGDPLTSHPDVDVVTFTGGEVTARAVASSAASGPRRTLMELGGKSPNIVFADANMEAAVTGVMAGIYAAGGQTCIAGSRALVQAEIYDDVVSRLLERAAHIRLGNPLEETTDIGPMAFEGHMSTVLGHIERARADGARVSLGGLRATEPGLAEGFFVEPTVIEGAASSSGIAQEEVFGPVLAVLPFTDEQDALRLANDSRYALAAGIWTQNLGRAHRVAAEIDAGLVWVNTYRMQSPQTPVGGFKSSGWGKENGMEAVLEYSRLKTVWIDASDNLPADPFTMNPR